MNTNVHELMFCCECDKKTFFPYLVCLEGNVKIITMIIFMKYSFLPSHHNMLYADPQYFEYMKFIYSHRIERKRIRFSFYNISQKSYIDSFLICMTQLSFVFMSHESCPLACVILCDSTSFLFTCHIPGIFYVEIHCRLTCSLLLHKKDYNFF